VANESSDVVSLVSFGQDGAVAEKAVDVGFIPSDLDGAHGVSVSPDGRYWYLSTAHGTPWGVLWKYETGTDSLIASVELGLFPATIGITPDGGTAFVANFNLHGDPVPSSISVVNTEPLEELGQIVTCVMPHGSRVAPSGMYAYSVCMHDDELVEISTADLVVTRRMALTPGGQGLKAAGAAAREPMLEIHREGPRCKPTWVEPAVGGEHVFVACNGHGEVLEIDIETMTVSRSFATGKAPYNLEVTADGRLLIATNKGEQSISVIDLAAGEELARIPSSRSITHGVVSSPDSRYAFVSNEAVGATFSTVDVFDLRSLTRVAEVEVQHQAGGIDFWRQE
jgi:DNA-binding beta-propeller fold protein YncE